MLPSLPRPMCVAVAALLGALLLQACGASEYKLEGEASTAQPAAVESSDESWTASLGELLLPLIWNHDTEYASGYSEEVFRSLDYGLGRAAVGQLLGPPLLTNEYAGGKVYWYYSRHGSRSDNYFVRILVFSEEGNLVAKRSSFYLD